MKKFAILLLLASCVTSSLQPVDSQRQSKLDEAAAGIERFVASDPANSQLRYIAAATHALAGHAAETASHLRHLDDAGWSLGVMRADFERVAADPSVNELLSRLEAKQPRVARSSLAHVLREDDLMPEGVAWDPTRDRLFVSSIRKRKVIEIGRDGSARDFVPRGYDGLLAVLGMKVDPAHEVLWVASSGEKSAIGITEKETGRSALYGFDLTSGGVRYKFQLPVPGQLNDLCVMNDGRVFVTDSQNGAIYTASGDSLELETFLEPGRVQWVNGIACDDAKRRLYAAQFAGIGVIDIASKQVTLMSAPKGAMVGGIDGLAMYGRSLLGIQNSFGRGRVIRMNLGADGKSIAGVEVLEAANPEFHIPTTGTIAGKQFVYIANSQLRMFENGRKTGAFRPPMIFRLPLE